MKRSYTNMIPWLRSTLKDAGVSWEVYLKKLESHCRNFGPNEFVMGYAFVIDKTIMDGKAAHIFMPDRSFCEWLVSCVPELNSTHASVVAQSIGDQAGCLHFPCESKLSSFGFWIPKLGMTLDGQNAVDYGMLVMSFSKDNNKDGLAQVSVLLKSDGHCSDKAMWYAKLIVGLGMYMSCFPEQVRNGIPEDLKHLNWYKKETTKTIGVSNKIATHEGPCPHYRIGHFRLLQNERFTKQRWKVVFVHGCFVKGCAKTVIGIDENKGEA